MPKLSVERSEISYNAAILAASRAREWQIALALFLELQQSLLQVGALSLGSDKRVAVRMRESVWDPISSTLSLSVGMARCPAPCEDLRHLRCKSYVCCVPKLQATCCWCVSRLLFRTRGFGCYRACGCRMGGSSSKKSEQGIASPWAGDAGAFPRL